MPLSSPKLMAVKKVAVDGLTAKSFGQQIIYIPEEESPSRAVGKPRKKLPYNGLHVKYPRLL